MADLHTIAINALEDDIEAEKITLNATLTNIILLNNNLLNSLNNILTEMKINNAYLQEIVGEKLTEKDLEE